MARIRTIKPGFFKDSELYDAEAESKLPLRVAYAGLWTVADRDGRFKWVPREIKTDVLPYDNVEMADVLDALVRYGFIFRYKCAGTDYGYIPKFSVHQHVNKNEAPSTIPAPPQNNKEGAKRVKKHSVTASAPSQHHEELVSGVREGEWEGKPTAKGASAPAVPDWIPETCWKHFSEMRHKIRKPLTPRAAELAIAKLERFKAEGLDIAAILDQSILNCWQDLWPPKINGTGQSEAELIGKVMAEAALRDQQNGEH